MVCCSDLSDLLVIEWWLVKQCKQFSENRHPTPNMLTRLLCINLCSDVRCITVFENKQSSQSYSTFTTSILKFSCSEMKFTFLLQLWEQIMKRTNKLFLFLTFFHIGENNTYGSSTNAVDLRLITLNIS